MYHSLIHSCNPTALFFFTRIILYPLPFTISRNLPSILLMPSYCNYSYLIYTSTSRYHTIFLPPPGLFLPTFQSINFLFIPPQSFGLRLYVTTNSASIQVVCHKFVSYAVSIDRFGSKELHHISMTKASGNTQWSIAVYSSSFG